MNAILFKDGLLLLGKRVGKVGYGMWCLPGGKLEFGEKFEDAARRELLEETGIKAGNMKFWSLVNDPRGEDHWIHINFLTESYEGEPTVTEPEKFESWKWFAMDQLPEEIFVGHKKILEALKSGQEFLD